MASHPGNINFLQPQQFEVTVFDDDHSPLGPATLHFGPERSNFLDCKIFRTDFHKLPSGKLQKPLKVKTQDGRYFSLFGCNRFDHRIHIELVATGDTSGNFEKINIRYNKISEWFLPQCEINLNNENIISCLPKENIDATIKLNETHFSLKTESVSSITSCGEDFTFHRHVIFSFEHITGTFDFKDIKTKTLDLANLLSILITHPISIVSVSVCSIDNSWHDIFFPSFKHIDHDTSRDFSRQCFIQQTNIENKWEEILNKYFKSRFREITWTRLAGMQRYEGFWEYAVLGYVALLDKYVTQKTNKTKKIQTDHKIIIKLETVLQNISFNLPQEQKTEIISKARDIFTKKITCRLRRNTTKL